MAKSVKKASAEPKAAAKPSKSAPKKTKTASNLTEMKLSYEQVAQLAHRYWIERGHAHGYHEEDWFRAEQELIGKAS